MPLSRTLAATVSCLFVCLPGAVLAARVVRVDIHGLDGPMQHNVHLALSLVDALDKEVSIRRLAYLMRVAESEAQQALEPFGYYQPAINIHSTEAGDQAIAVELHILPGEPVRVRQAQLAITGEGKADVELQRALDRFVPGSGEIFNHADYEASKLRINRVLTERGYFAADLATHRVAVERAEHSAEIDLTWNSGVRYRMGQTIFVQTPTPRIHDRVLRNLMDWSPGDAYLQSHLDRLRQGLGQLDYFSQIEIEPQVDQALDTEVPIQVTLTPAKRSVYTSGLSYGTDSGFGIRLGLERRYVNVRGHKILTQLDYAQKRKTLTMQYRIPAFAWHPGWYSVSAQGYDEQTDYIDTRRLELVTSRSAQYRPEVNLVASVHTLRERWAYDVDIDATGRALYRRANYSYPSLRADYARLDDRLYPRRGLTGWAVIRSGIDGARSDATFMQINARASVFWGLGEQHRIILRGEIGHTFTNALNDMPPSLRFYAGGDRSIRGYDWREVGPRLVRFAVDANNQPYVISSYALGARNMLTTSLEWEHYFNSSWGMAVFVDGGSAFDGVRPDWHTGVGMGMRWKSPVGPLRLDIARGLNQPDSPFTLGVGLGVEF